MNEQTYTVDEAAARLRFSLENLPKDIEAVKLAIDCLHKAITPPPEYQDGDVAIITVFVEPNDERSEFAVWRRGRWETADGLHVVPARSDLHAKVTNVEMIRPAGSVCVTPNWEWAAKKGYAVYLCDHGLMYESDVYIVRDDMGSRGKVIRKLEPPEGDR